MPTRTPDAPFDHPAAAGTDPGGAGSPASPEMPSFASLRDPRRRSPIDLLVPPAARPDAGPRPPAAQVPPAARPAQVPPSSRSAAQVPSSSRPAHEPPPAASRPPEWADLWHLAAHVTVALAAVPVRVVRWQGRCLRTLLGV